MATFTIQDILNARPNLGIELLSADTKLVREDSGYSVEMRGFYSVPELIAIADDIKTLNSVFEERPETDSFLVVNEFDGEVIGNPYAKREEAERAISALDESAKLFETFIIRVVPTK